MSGREISPVKIVQALLVTESVTSGYEYPNLDLEIHKQEAFLGDRWAYFEAAPQGSLEVTEEARGLALFYILKTAKKLGEVGTQASKELWSKRFTDATGEVYGIPSRDDLVPIAEWFLQGKDDGLMESELRTIYESLIPADSGGVTPSPEFVSPNITEVYRSFLCETYADLFELVENKLYTPAELEQFFNNVLAKMALRDEGWKLWAVEQREQPNCEAVGDEHLLVVGSQREPADATAVTNLIVHEVLVHALRRVNGEKTGDRITTEGIPGYLDFEEGLSVFHEFTVTGKINVRAFDRYFDTALALGVVDGELWPRDKLLDFVVKRARYRKLLANEAYDEANVYDEMKTYIRRVYRGGPGEVAGKYLAVNTKDCGYYTGFRKACGFIEAAIGSGQTPEAIFTYLASGKFDATDPQHVEYVSRFFSLRA